MPEKLFEIVAVSGYPHGSSWDYTISYREEGQRPVRRVSFTKAGALGKGNCSQAVMDKEGGGGSAKVSWRPGVWETWQEL